MKLNLIKALGLFLSLCILNLKAEAQATSQTQYFVPILAPRSPAATAIEKYGTYQVSEYSGVPDISIPLYTIDAGEFKVPITLSYHASGNKVTDVASWAGLGWSVSSGGQVTRRTMGLQDDCVYGYLNGYMHIPNNNSYNTMLGIDSIEYASNGTYDTRPDIYSYDFPAHGGKFFFDGSAGNNYVPRLMPFAPLKITYVMSPYAPPNNPASSGLTRFNIADEHGNTYAFGDSGGTELTVSSSGGRPTEAYYASAWKLENMISQNRRDTVSFTYQTDHVNYPASDSEIFTVADNVNNMTGTAYYTPSYTSTPTTIGNINDVIEKLPQQINFKNGKVVFDLDSAQRTDLPGTGSGAYGLKDIKVYRYNYGTKVMELQKTIVFYKSYFSANSTTRLRLDSIQIQDKAGSIIQHYRFDYNTSITLPDYTSYAQDYWGYYNGNYTGIPGKIANTMLTPLQTISYSPNSGNTPENVSIGQANRNCDSNYMQAYILTGIHYPTGGYTTFTYQTNQYNASGVLNLAGGLRVKTISSYDGVSAIPIVKTYVYSNNAAQKNYFMNYAYFETLQTHRYYAAVTQQAAPNLVATEDVRTFTSSPHCDLEAYDGTIVVYPNVSEYIGTPGNNIGRTDYTFSWVADQVSDASAAGPLIYLSAFYSRGHLLAKKEFMNKGGGIYQPVSLTTNSYTAFPATDYSQVGLAIHKKNYNEGAEGNPIPKGATYYDDTNSYQFYTYDIISDDNYLTGTANYMYDTNDSTKMTASAVNYKYDNIVHQQITRTYHVDSKGNTNVTRSKYPADYSHGYAVIDSMVNRNMQADVIEKYDTLKNAATSTNAITSAQLNTYATQYSYAILPSKISTLSVTQPITNFTPASVSGTALTSDSRYVQMISFDQYDVNNNIVQYTPRNSTPVSIMWDYQNYLPVAQIKNATYSSTTIAYTGFEAGNKGNWIFSGTPVNDPTAPVGTMVYPLTAGSITSLTLSGSSPYVLSYWSNSGAATVVASSSTLTGTALNSRNGWTYYEYQVPGGTYLTISGTTSIDELRLYPAAAQMSTYAYDPSGVRAMADTKGSVNYFEYDFFQRLKNMKDWNGNIVKNYGYHTYDQTIANTTMTATFTRNNCASGTNPGSAAFTVPAAKYYSSTLASANAEATYDLNTNGQANANATCGCPIQTVSVTLSNSTGITGFTAAFNGISTPFNFPTTGSTAVQVPVGSYSSVYIGPVGSATHTFGMTGFSSQSGVHYATFSTVTIATGSNITISIQ